MIQSCLNTICCDTDGENCFTQLCTEAVKVDSEIAAIAILENDVFPSIGDTITLPFTGTTVLTACNYAENILYWIRAKQLSCASGNGKYYHFLHTGFVAKGTRAKPTSKRSENSSNYFAKKYLGYSTTAEIMLQEHFLYNSEVFCNMQQRAASLSIAYFTKNGAFVLNSSEDFNVSIQEAGFEITGVKNEYIMGSFTLEETGLCQPKFHFVASPKAFIQSLKVKAEFTFTPTPVVTGLVEVPCGFKGACRGYSIAPATAFTMTPVVIELNACGNFELLQDCGDAPTVPISIDKVTGVVTSTAGLVVGDYKFIIRVSNDCCVSGTQCFSISVK